MNRIDEHIQVLKLEAAVTRKFLALVPFNKHDFKPNEKSESLGRLAVHVAEIIAWWTTCIEKSELDFIDFEPKEISTTNDLLAYFDELLEMALVSLKSIKPEALEQNWTMRHGETIYFTLPKNQVLQIFCLHHLVHHRAQLGVYLRMLDIDLPATYGPSADDENVLLIERYNI